MNYNENLHEMKSNMERYKGEIQHVKNITIAFKTTLRDDLVISVQTLGLMTILGWLRSKIP